MTEQPPPATDKVRVSDQLEEWIESDEPTTMGTLGDAFGDTILAVAILILMTPSALPLPSGGATHVFQIVAFLLAGQLVLGRNEMWIPKRWENTELGEKSAKVLRWLVRAVRRCERYSHPRLAGLIDSRVGRTVSGLLMAVFIVAAFFSPPFSGLDTLPSLGVVLIALGVILEDIVFVLVGTAVGTGGVGLTIALGAKAAQLARDIF